MGVIFCPPRATGSGGLSSGVFIIGLVGFLLVPRDGSELIERSKDLWLLLRGGGWRFLFLRSGIRGLFVALWQVGSDIL